MSKSKDDDVRAWDRFTGLGERCRKCNGVMARFEHGPAWEPQPGRGYYKFWDRCDACRRVQHYKEAKVAGSSHRNIHP